MKSKKSSKMKSVPSSKMDSSSNFLSAMASLEGHPRFLHHSDQRNLDANVATLVGKHSKLDLPPNILKPEPTESSESKDTPPKSKKLRKQSLKLSSSLTLPNAQRQHRSALYARANDELGGKWQSLVHSRRIAPQLFFPLKPLRDPKSRESRFQPETPLEMEVARLLAGSKAECKEREEERQSGLSKREQSKLARVTMAEALAKHSDVARLRALQSYVSVKLKRTKRIKSRKYRRVVRKAKEKEKWVKKEKDDDKEDKDKEEEDERVERTRIRERATLRHRNTSAYLRMQARRKKDPEAREVVQEQLRLHRELVTKTNETEDVQQMDEDKDVDDELEDNDQVDLDTDNPWLRKPEEKLDESQNESVADFRAKVSAFVSQSREAKREKEVGINVDQMFEGLKDEDEDEEEINEDEEEVNEDEENDPDGAGVQDLEMAKKLDEQVHEVENQSSSVLSTSKEYKSLEPDVFVSTSNISRLPTLDEDVVDEDIMEAFAADDVAMDFADEKRKKNTDNDGPKRDLLKGWGEWAGPGCPSRRRRSGRRQPLPLFSLSSTNKSTKTRRDAKKPTLILNEDKESSVSKHQVRSVPFPFNSVKDFEASIRAPVGDTFVPRLAFKDLTKPKVVTKAGRIIEPMDGEELIKRDIIDVVVNDDDDDDRNGF